MSDFENPLQDALSRARKSAMARRQFLELLLDSEVVVVGQNIAGKVQLAFSTADGKRLIPFFTSTARLQRHVKKTVDTLTMTGRTLMQMTRGDSLVVDLSSVDWFEITADEIARLLDAGPAHKIVLH